MSSSRKICVNNPTPKNLNQNPQRVQTVKKYLQINSHLFQGINEITKDNKCDQNYQDWFLGYLWTKKTTALFNKEIRLLSPSFKSSYNTI